MIEWMKEILGDAYTCLLYTSYTPRTTHDKDVGELREKISRISENYLTKEDFYRENTKTDRKIESANQKIDRVIELQMQLLQQLSQKENS